MVSCVSTREGDDYAKCPLTVSARSLYNQALSLAEGQVAIVETSLEDTMSEAESFAVRVVNAYERLSNLVDSLTSWFDSRATPDFFDQVSLLDFFAAPPSFCSNVYQTGSCDFPSLDFDALPEARYLYPDELDLAYANFLHNMSLASVETFSRAVEMKETLIAAVGGLATISDYSPPKYSAFGGDVDNVDEESERHQAEADAFVEQQANTLNSASLQSEFDNDDGSIYNFNLTEASDATSVDLLDVFSWITPLEESRVDWGEIFVVGMSRLTTLLLIFDYVWRVVQSYRVIQRFWGRSGVKLPRPDLRFDSSDDRGQYCECLIKYVWLISTVSSSLIILIVLVIAACVVVTAAYQPIFNEYQRGCVRDDTNGTFLSSNLNSVAYNYASIEGSSQYTRRIGDYDAARTEACSVYSTSTQFERKRLKLASYIESFETSASGIEKLEDCVDVESMSAEFDRVCCGLENYEPCSIGDSVFHNGTFCPRDGNGEPHLKIRDYLGGCSSTDDAWYSLNDDEDFDCDNLPLCSTTCDGPNREVVEVVTKQCACTAEYYAHSHFLRISLALLIYVLTNLSRFIFVSAACKLLWRQLTPELVDCTITSTLQGDLLIPPRMSCGAAGVNPMAAAASSPPDDDESTEPAKASVIVTDNNISFQEKSFSTSHSGNASMSSQKPPHLEVPLGYQHLLQRKIKSEIASWERSAWLELVLALLVNVPWIVLMRLANDDDIVYTP